MLENLVAVQPFLELALPELGYFKLVGQDLHLLRELSVLPDQLRFSVIDEELKQLTVLGQGLPEVHLINVIGLHLRFAHGRKQPVAVLLDDLVLAQVLAMPDN